MDRHLTCSDDTIIVDHLTATLPASPESQAQFFAPRATFASGEVLAGRYEIVRFIAHGGMGDVYEVHDRELRIRVALKMIRTEHASDVMVERFRRELFLARQVTHPNVCRVYDLGRHDDKLFLTMELLAGETLAQRLARGGRFTTTDTLLLARQIASAIEAAHAVGVVHRDLKPGNIMLIARERAIVTDFGIAHAADDPFHQISRVGDVIGSPDYMAPEQIVGGPITPAADIFAFGTVLYELVTGVRPFRGQLGRGEVLPPHVHVPDLDPRWSAAILRCLAPATGERFASAGEVIDALAAQPIPTSRRRAHLAATCLAVCVGVASWQVVPRAHATSTAPPALDADAQLALAQSQVERNRGTEALATIAQARLQLGATTDPRLDLVEAAAAETTGDFLREQSAAERAELSGSPLVVAQAKLALARAYAFQGKPEQAITRARDAARMFELAGDKDHEARALATEASALGDRGDIDEAERIDEQVLAMRRATGDRKNVARMLINLGLLVENRGQLARAQQLSLEALGEVHALGDHQIEVLALIRLAAIANASGDPAIAITRVDEAMAVRAPDDLRDYYFALECRAAAEATMGRSDAAREHLEQALEVARRVGAVDGAADDLVFVANTRIDAKDLEGARHMLEEAAAFAADHLPASVAWRLAVTARLALVEHHPEQAAQDARAALDRLVQLGLDLEALAPAQTLAEALLARGDLVAAGAAVDRLAALHVDGRLSRLTIALLRAELANDRTQLVKIRDEAAASNLVAIERDAGQLLAAAD